MLIAGQTSFASLLLLALLITDYSGAPLACCVRSRCVNLLLLPLVQLLILKRLFFTPEGCSWVLSLFERPQAAFSELSEYLLHAPML